MFFTILFLSNKFFVGTKSMAFIFNVFTSFMLLSSFIILLSKTFLFSVMLLFAVVKSLSNVIVISVNDLSDGTFPICLLRAMLPLNILSFVFVILLSVFDKPLSKSAKRLFKLLI